MNPSEIIAASPPSQADPSRTAAEVMLEGWDLALQFFQTDGPAANFIFHSVAQAGKQGIEAGFIEHIAQLAMLPEDQQRAEIEILVAQTVAAMIDPQSQAMAMQALADAKDAAQQRAWAERQYGAERRFED